MTKKLIIGLAVIVAIVSGILYGRGLLNVHQGLTPPAGLSALALDKAPKPAPAVTFADAAGGRHQLADFKGRYVLLNLWATWCAPCVAELPALANLSSQAVGLKVLAINTDHEKVDAGAFLKGHKAGSLPVYLDSQTMMLRSFKAYGLPMTVLIDPDGKIVARADGPAAWDSDDAVKYFKRITGS